MKGNLRNLQVGYGTAKGSDSLAVGTEAAHEAVRQVKESPLAAVLVFASVRYELEEVLQGIHAVVGEAPVLGATGAGEICNTPQQESVVVVALASPYLQVRVGVGQRVSRDWRQAVAQAVKVPAVAPFFSLEDSNIWVELTRQGKSAFGLLFSPGNTQTADSRSCEILEELKRLSLGRVPFVGGAAADDWRLETNYVLWGRRAYPDSVLVAVFETQLRFGLALAHGFRPTTRRATVTRADDHEVLELDGRPAAEIYSRLQGLSREALTGNHLTLTTGRPLGVAEGFGEYSLNVASFFTGAGGVRFTQPVPEGSVLTVMEAEIDDLVAAGAEAFHKALMRGAIIDPALVLVFPCALRSPLLGERHHEVISAIRNLVPGLPVAGFYSFGEQGLSDDGQNRHNNEVIAVLALGRELSYGAQVALENERLSRELRTTRDQLLRLLSCSPAMIYSCQPSGDYGATYISENVTAQLGYEPREFLEDPGFWAEHVHPEDAPGVFAGMASLFDQGHHSQEYRFRHQDGSWRWMHDDRTLIRDAHGRPQEIIGYWVDVTGRRQTQEALRASESRYRLLVENIDLGITLIGTDYKVVMTNAAQGRMFHKPSDEFAGKECFREFEKREQACPHCPGTRAMASGQPATVFTEGIRDDGSRINARIHAFPTYGPEGEVSGFIEVVEDITAYKQAEKALRTSEARYRQFVETANEGIWSGDRDFRTTFVNKFMAEWLGYAPEEMIGKPFSDFFFPEDLAVYQRKKRERQRGVSARFEWRFRRKDGSELWAILSSTPQMDEKGEFQGAFVMITDITERKVAEERYKTIVQTALDGFCLVDTQGRIVEANEAYCKMIGYTQDELTRLTISDIEARMSPEVVAQATQQLIADGAAVFESQHRKKDGSIIDVEVALRYLPQGDRGLIFAFHRDITERKRAEEARLQLSKLESLGTLAGGIAHDFNNILTAILGNVSLARLDLENAEATRKTLQATENACQEAQRLAQQLLTFARGGAPLKELIAVANLVTKTGTFACRGSRARLTFSFPDDLWAVEADPGQISQVIQNLVINAREAMPTGGTITVTGENLEVAAPSDLPLEAGKYVKVSLHDQGVGIPAQHLPNIFDPYFTTKHTGSGLGLATAYSIVKNHGGHIAVESTLGMGTTFHIYLPAVGRKIRALPPKEMEVVAGQGKILVMDDEKMVRHILGSMLGRLGYEVDLARNGAEALKLFTLARESGQAYAAVILDLTVPGGMGGKDTLEQLLKLDPQVKAIVSSGYSHDAVMAEFAKYGFSGVIAKPYRVSELSKVLNKILREDRET